jgi:DNA-binding GntR family transcriptional regulator
MIARQHKGRPTLVDRVVEHAFQKIVRGEYAPGSKITEEQLAEEVDVSRTPVREAVKRLSDLGLLIVRPRSGLVVASVDQRDVREVRAVRQALEGLAVRLAMQRAKTADIERLEAIQQECEQMLERGADRLAIFRQDSRLHLALAELSGNSHLEETLRRLDVKVMLCRMYLCMSMEKIARDVRSHRRIIEAMAAGQVETAVQLVRDHVRGTTVAEEALA